MCTAMRMVTKDHYFGRTLDLDRSYGEEVCILPRRHPLSFRQMGEYREHYAIIGMATVVEGIPLFYDAANEHGLAMAGLNFPGNAYYAPLRKGKDNIAPFAFIPWILGQCKSVREAERLLSRINLCDIPFSNRLPLSPLHWMISDRTEAIVAEPMRNGLHIHQNPVGVLTNNPPFAAQLKNRQRYRHLRPDHAEAIIEEETPYVSASQGLGAVGLPGDVSSMSRFVRAAYGLEHSVCEGDEASSVGQLFHLLSSVEMVRGTCRTEEGTLDITGYTSCINADRGRYYYTTYTNRRITCVELFRTDLDAAAVKRFPLLTTESIAYQA